MSWIPGHPYATDTERVRYLMERDNISLYEAKRMVVKDNLLTAISDAESVHDLKIILEAVVNAKF